MRAGGLLVAACLAGGIGAMACRDAALTPASSSSPGQGPATASAPASGAAPGSGEATPPATALPDSRDAERLEPQVRDEILAAIAAARPLLDGRALRGDQLELAARTCVLEHAHQLNDDALDCYARVGRAAPKDPRWPYLLGHVQLGRGQREPALAAFERSLALAPGRTEILSWLGQVLYDLQRFDESRARLLEALAIDPDNAFALFRLGQLELQEGHAAEAVTRLERALQLQPKASATHHALAQALREAGRDAEAEEHARQAGQARPGLRDPWLDVVKMSGSGERMHVDRGGRAVKHGDLEKAEAEFRLALADDPNSVDAWLNLGSVLSRRGDAPGAREALTKALALAPEDPVVRFNLGVVSAAQGDDREAITRYQEALRLDPNHAGARFNLGNAQLRLGQWEAAAATFQAVLATDGANVDARLGASASLVAVQRDKEARAILEQGLVASPGHPELSTKLARLLSTSRDAAVRDGGKALGLATTAVQATPTLESVEALAMACAETGQFGEAIKWQQAALESARKAGRQDLAARIEATLNLYRKSQPLRLP